MGQGLARGRRLTRRDFLLLSAGAGAGVALSGCGAARDQGAVARAAAEGGGTYTGPPVQPVSERVYGR